MFFHQSHIPPEEAKELIETGKAVLLDVREADEFRNTHIKGAVTLPLGDMPGNLALLPDKGKTYIVYCQSGHRSARAKQIMEGNGYRDIRDLGGIFVWPYEVEHAE